MDEEIHKALRQLIEKTIKGDVTYYHRTVRTGTQTSAHVNIPMRNIGKKAFLVVFDDVSE